MSPKSRKVSETCCLCFTRDRRLSPIGAKQWIILQNALDCAPLQYSRDLHHKSHYQLCWECRSHLQKAAMFLDKVQRSFNCFEDYLASSSKAPPAPCSNLLTTCLESIDVRPSDVDPNGLLTTPESELKQETGYNDIECNYKVEFFEPEKCAREPTDQPPPKLESSAVDAERNLDNCRDDTCHDDTCHDDTCQDDTCHDDTCQDGEAGDELDVEGTKPIAEEESSQSEARSKEIFSEGKRKKGSVKKGRHSGKSPRPARTKDSKGQYSRQWMSTEQALSWHEAERGQTLAVACVLCRHSFETEEQLSAHLREIHHESVGPYECNICKHRFAQQTALLEHTEAHYVLYKCQNCQYETKTLTVMQAHLKTHSGKREVQKSEGEGREGGGKRGKASERVKKKEKRDSYQCRRCKESFGSFPLLQAHRSSCETYKCDKCDETFNNSGALYRHGKVHREGPETLHYCQTCDTHYKSSWFKKHFEISLKHVTRDAYKHECPHCKRRFLVLRRLREHIGSVHLKLGIFKCHLCPKSYMNEKVLKMHQAKIHSIDKVEKKRDKICEHCGKGFTCNLYLKNHMRSHTGEKPFQCTLCARAFAQSGTLYTHIKTVHRKKLSKDGCTDSPGYQCEECGKQFVTNARLQAHYNFYHLKNTNYKCEDCNKMFISVAALKCHRANRHATITTKSLACGTCGKEFRTASARHTHMKTPRPGGVYCA